MNKNERITPAMVNLAFAFRGIMISAAGHRGDTERLAELGTLAGDTWAQLKALVDENNEKAITFGEALDAMEVYKVVTA